MDFKNVLEQKLSQKDLSQNSVKLYLRNLEKLNNNQPLKNFNFLKDIPSILDKIKDKKDNTQRAYLISIVVCLSTIKDTNKVFNKLYEDYRKMMLEKASEIRQNNTHKVPDEKKDDFISWDDVREIYNNLHQRVSNFKGELNSNQYNTLLNLVVLSLYIHHPPRRNKDYQLLRVITGVKNPESLSAEYNYLDLTGKKFIFNNFKTSKKEGQVVIDISPELFKIIELYLKHHPLFPKKVKDRKSLNIPFLVDSSGKELDKVNDITRILNRIFDKKIGSSMLRSIYLTSKYGDIKEEQEKDSKLMSHTTQTQNETYIKKKE